MNRHPRTPFLLIALALAGLSITGAQGKTRLITPEVAQAVPSSVLPQFAFGGGWYSALYFTNTTASPVSFAVSFISDTGTPLVVPSVGASTANLNIAAHGTAIIQALNSGNLVEGYATFTLPAGVTGYGVFRQSVTGLPDQEAVVPFSDAQAVSSMLTWDEANLTTAVAIVNPSSTANTVAVTLWDEGGATVGTSSVPLPPGNKTAVLLRNLTGLGGMVGERGSAQFSVSTGAVAVLGLRANGSALTSIPTTTSTADALPTTNVLPQLAFGGGWYSALYFTNTTASSVSFPVNFVSDTGTPLVVPSVGADIANLNIAAHGTYIIQALNSGNLVEGYATFTLPAGVTGYGVFRHSVTGLPDQEAVVPFSDAQAVSSMLTWDEANLTTAVAIVNPSSTANTVAVTLWDQNGATVGTSSVPLPPGNKTAVLLRNLTGLSGMVGERGSAQFSVSTGAVAVLGLRANGSALTSIPTSAPQSAGSSGLVTERALAQTGLAIGMASIVLQSQLNIAFAIVERITYCDSLPGGGSVRMAASGTETVVSVYYDSQCTKPYIVTGPSTKETIISDALSITETATYYGLSGTKIGTLNLNETALIGEVGWTVYGLGGFTPASGSAPPVQLGLYCSLTAGTSLCAGGIAQDFPALGIAIGGVTPLTLAVSDLNSPVSFSGGGSVVTGPIGSLTLTSPSPTSLVIQGGTAYATTTASGSAASFALFPPTPTSWTLTDSAHDQQFQISVVDNTTRNLTMTITQLSTGASLATGSLDQSGSGTITWSDGTTAAITNWTLAD
jgi:hypothetical protein